MKNFLEHLVESQKTYDFRIKIADIDPTDRMDQLEAVLDAYGLDTITKPKSQPIVSTSPDFPSFKSVQVYTVDVTLKYPVNDAQLRQLVSERWMVPSSNIVVVPRNHPEELWRNKETYEINEYKKGESVLDKEYETCPEAVQAGKDYAEVKSFLKELSKIEYNAPKGEKSKTTNDLPQGNTNPVNTNKKAKGK